MSDGLIGFVAIIYLAVTVSEALEKNFGMSIMFAGYAAANVGIILARHHQ